MKRESANYSYKATFKSLIPPLYRKCFSFNVFSTCLLSYRHLVSVESRGGHLISWNRNQQIICEPPCGLELKLGPLLKQSSCILSGAGKDANTRNHLGEKDFISSYTSRSQPITESSQGRISQQQNLKWKSWRNAAFQSVSNVWIQPVLLY